MCSCTRYLPATRSRTQRRPPPIKRGLGCQSRDRGVFSPALLLKCHRDQSNFLANCISFALNAARLMVLLDCVTRQRRQKYSQSSPRDSSTRNRVHPLFLIVPLLPLASNLEAEVLTITQTFCPLLWECKLQTDPS